MGDPLTDAVRELVRAEVRAALAELHTANAPQWLPLERAAERVGVKPRTLSAARRRGEIVGYAAGHGYAYLVSDLAVWTASRRREPAAPATQPTTDAQIVAASIARAREAAR